MISLSETVFLSNALRLVHRFNDVARDTKKPMVGRIIDLKKIVDEMCLTATDNLNQARIDQNFLGLAIVRTQTIIDLLADDEHPGAIALRQSGALDPMPNNVETIWGDLGQYIDAKLYDLRLSLNTALDSEAQIVEARIDARQSGATSAPHIMPRPQR